MTALKVIKRDGKKIAFNKERIYGAILKAAAATEEFDSVEARKITEIATRFIEKGQRIRRHITVEEIQDIVEFALMSSGYFKTARAYIVYREKRMQVRSTQAAVVEVEKTIGEYLDRSDWRVNANANQGYSLGGLILNTSGKLTANYWLNVIYPKEVRDSHIEGDFHIHDLDMFSGYCAGWSLRQLLEEGFNGVPGKVESAPPKHLETAVAQMVNFLGTLQNEWAGAQAFSSFDTYLAPFIKLDKMDYKQVKQCVQQFVFNLNVPSRWGTQTPFTNITLDWTVPDDMREKKPIIGGAELDFTYGDCQLEMDIINKAFIEVMTEGDYKGRIFTFPIPTYNITKDFDWDNENAQALFEMTAKFGTPYFQNFLNSSLNPSDVRSMCCRLQLDLRELRSRGGGLFGSAEMTGSIGVVTINLARIGYLAKTKKEFFDRLGRLMDIAKESLEIKRKVVSENIDRGLLPFTKRYLPSLQNHFATIGLNGANEASLNFLGKDIETKEGRAFTLEVLDFMRDRLADYQEATGNLYNLEATPAEGATYRFAREDQQRYPGIVQAGTKEGPYYTNSSHLPVSCTDDPLYALDHQDELQTRYTGGTVLHMFLGERVKDWKTCRSFVKKVAENYSLPYFTITPTFSICPNHGYIVGEVAKCPTCKATTEVWSRIVGYFRPVDQWNTGKKSEYKQREEYDVVKGIKEKVQTVTNVAAAASATVKKIKEINLEEASPAKA
ncbi:MAG: ribonucleoside triphosphate reductase [Candidatus Buchananbacteria bacterium RIFCSPHIGHO2_01_FULL_47_11b]|uniref:Ribonucleoside triphosphate reductase n=1 Tax=Candidatus Buchananbacteria bacterium RIFCSPHIGHO2_01_FULL_47_11b TaxID=1797537 RepID=A0A1G1Y6W5_9BACT|nr:MAG: ribonucleoside triphosphate reductase [Candidatus Buchananbacteria bacterium RIFCSPHIGHO2_01_FULL_47_11b]